MKPGLATPWQFFTNIYVRKRFITIKYSLSKCSILACCRKIFYLTVDGQRKVLFLHKIYIMLQRIQSLYLMCTALLMAAVTFTGNVIFNASDAIYSFSYMGVVDTLHGEIIYPTWPLVILSSLTAFLALVSIFFYKKRMLQIRFSIFNLVLIVGYIPMLIYYVLDITKELGVTTMTYKISAVFPLIAAILTFLAIRAIGKDEALVRSLDRIR